MIEAATPTTRGWEKILRLGRHPALRPGAALIGWGCILPFAALIDSYALSFSPRALIGIFGTNFLALATLAIIATALFGAVWLIIHWARRTPLLAFVEWLSSVIFLLVFFYSVRCVVMAWASRHGYFVTLLPSLAAIVPLSLVLAYRARRLVNDLIGFSWFLAALGVCSLPFAFVDTDSTPPPTPITAPLARPDILMVTIDTLSARQMSLYGAPQPTTPNIDRLAAKALVFDRAYAGGNFTTAGINTLLLGRYPDEHRAVQLYARALPRYRGTSIPALLKSAGYHTTYVSTNTNAGPWHNGYARYFDDGVGDATNWRPYFCEDELIRWLPFNCQLNNPFLNAVTSHLTPSGKANLQFDGRLVMAGAERLIDQARTDRRPFFLWTHLTPPHDPYAAPAPCLGHFYSGPEHRTIATSQPVYGLRPADVPFRTTQLLEQRYRESLWCADRTVGQIVEAFRTRGRPFVLLLAADHGESFTLHLTGHGGNFLNEDVIHIPLMVALPGMARGVRSNIIASQTDLLPMVQAILAGADVSAIQALVAARRRQSPAFAMEFIDNQRLSALRNGGIAAIDEYGKYVRYLSPPSPLLNLREQWIGVAPYTAEGRQLRSAVEMRLSRYAGAKAP